MARTPDAATDPRGYAQAQGTARDIPPLRQIQQQRFMPVQHEGTMEDAPHQAKLTVDLGGEAMRTLIRLVEGEDAVIVEITGVCMSRNHSFRQGDFVRARRQRHMSGRDDWKADRTAISEVQLAQLAEQRRKRLDAEQAATRGAKMRRGAK